MLSMDVRTVFNVNDWFSILPEFYTRTIISPEEDNLFYANYVGGTFRGRYLETQIPFVGFNQVTPSKSFTTVLNVDFRAQLAKSFYASMMAGYFTDCDHFPTSFRHIAPTYLGLAGELAYDSLIGPVRARLQWSDFRGWSAYVGVGFDF